MQFDLRTALDSLRTRGTVFQIANRARPNGDYVFATILPEEKRFSYQASSGSMTVRATMAGLSGMDSPYPEGGALDVTKFTEETAKLGIRVRLPEQQLRELQELLFRVAFSGGNTLEAVQRVALNFVNHLIVQPHLDSMEWLRGQALTTGMIDWTFNGKRLLVDYGIPAANFLPASTGASGWGGNSSRFWTDLHLLRRRLKNEVAAYIMHSETKEMILANPANNIQLTAEDLDMKTFSIQRIRPVVGAQAGAILSTDPRDRAAFMTYDAEGEIWDLANPGKTKKISFMPRGVILGIGRYVAKRFIIGEGSTEPPPKAQLGYTHLAPTTESGGQPGRWSDVRTPDGEPWAMEGRGVTNGIPVIEAEERVATASSEMA